jgi:hypothetical protein
MLRAIISSIMRLSNNTDGVPLRGTPLGSLAVGQVDSPYLDRTRSGRRFYGGTQIIANGIAPVAAIPTTTATLGLFNGDTGGSGMSLDLDWLNVFLGSGTPAAGLTVFGAVFKPTNPPSVNATGYGSASCSGSGRGSKALWGTALTAPAGTNWSALFSTLQAAAANVGQGDNFVDTGGRIVVPPGYAFGLGILSGAGTTPLYGVGAQWGETENTLE